MRFTPRLLVGAAAAASIVGSAARAVTITGVGQAGFSIPASPASEFSGLTYLGGNSFYGISDNDSFLYPLMTGVNTSTGAINSFNIATGVPLTLCDSSNTTPLASGSVDIEDVQWNPAHNSVYIPNESW